MTIIANLTLLAAALFALFAMLRWDTLMQQLNGFSNHRYNTWLRQSGELSSIKRLTVLAVLIACFTTMAQTSWIVVMILAAVLVGQGIALFMAKHDKPVKRGDKRVTILLLSALVIAVIAVGAAGYAGSLQSKVIASQSAAITAVMILAVSPLLIMLASWLLHPILKHGNDNTED